MHFLRSLIYTVFSPKFYADAVKKGSKKAWGVFFLFTILTTVISFVAFAFTSIKELSDIPNQYKDFPDTIIQNGELQIENTKMPVTLSGRTCILVDTRTNEFDLEKPDDCHTALYLRKERFSIKRAKSDKDLSFSYDEILDKLNKDSIEITNKDVSRFWKTIGILIILVSPIFIFITQVLDRLFRILLVTLLGFLLFSIMKQKNAFIKSFIISMYVIIPINYIWTIEDLLLSIQLYKVPIEAFLFMRSLYRPPIFLYIINWGIFWGIGAYGVSKMKKAIEA